jgi:hypothetical protein
VPGELAALFAATWGAAPLVHGVDHGHGFVPDHERDHDHVVVHVHVDDHDHVYGCDFTISRKPDP